MLTTLRNVLRPELIGALLLVFVAGGTIVVVPAWAQAAADAAANEGTGETLPRFASLKADEVHVRKGPGREYDILWTYRSIGLPVEITAEHEHWRRVRDSEGAEGWVYFRLLSGARFALIAPWEKSRSTTLLHERASTSSGAVAKLEPGVKVFVKSCSDSWCLVSVSEIEGWVESNRLWGVYPGEVIR